VTELWAVGLTLLAVLVGAIGPILLKKGADQFSLNPKKLLRNKALIGGGVCIWLGHFDLHSCSSRW